MLVGVPWQWMRALSRGGGLHSVTFGSTFIHRLLLLWIAGATTGGPLSDFWVSGRPTTVQPGAVSFARGSGTGTIRRGVSFPFAVGSPDARKLRLLLDCACASALHVQYCLCCVCGNVLMSHACQRPSFSVPASFPRWATRAIQSSSPSPLQCRRVALLWPRSPPETPAPSSTLAPPSSYWRPPST